METVQTDRPGVRVRIVAGLASTTIAIAALLSACGDDPPTSVFTETGPMTSPRSLHNATLLADGRVLLAGGASGGDASTALVTAELYDPASRSFSPTGSMSVPRLGAASLRLSDGRVMMIGGEDTTGISVASVELYTPATGRWATTGAMGADRVNPTATELPDGRVLVVGGYQGNSSCCALASAEIYDPATGEFTATGAMATARRNHTATLLNDGRVLVAGGYNGSYLDAPELYDPATGSFTAAASMGTPRRFPTANLLVNGRVLVVGGFASGTEALASADLYEPRAGTFTPTGAMTTARGRHTATRLPNGKVLIAGGYDLVNALASAEVFDPESGRFSPTGSMKTPRWRHTETRLLNGDVLIAGGRDDAGPLASAELYR